MNDCSYCYARKLANGRLKQRYLANFNTAPFYGVGQPVAFPGRDPFYPRFWPERLEELHSRNRSLIEHKGYPERRGIFLVDMGDLFGIGIPEDWTNEVLNAIDMNLGYDRFYLLTHQPQNLIKWSPFPMNCWVGVTATNTKEYLAALAGLATIKAKVKYISFEPLLDRIIVNPPYTFDKDINWLIIGAQTKPYKPPKIEWVQEIVKAADKANIPVFIKDNLAPYAHNLSIYPDMRVGDKGYDELRQEMPK